MARNRKTQWRSLRLGTAMKAVVMCTLLAGAAVGYVIQKQRLVDLAREIREREILVDRLRWQNKLWAAELAQQEMPLRVRERVEREGLGLSLPSVDRVIWLVEPGGGQERTGGVSEMAMGDGRQ